MFEYGQFLSHSGLMLPWKVNLDCLTNDDWAALAEIVCHKFLFSTVVGVPTGGLKLASALLPHCVAGYPELVVDDVWTTGNSMREWRRPIPGPAIGVVVFARGQVDDWVWPMFIVQEWTQSRGTGVG